jgi:hypothetical protein
MNEYDKEMLIRMDAHIDAILTLMTESDMESDSANQWRDEMYAYLNPQQLRLQGLIHGRSPLQASGE